MIIVISLSTSVYFKMFYSVYITFVQRWHKPPKQIRDKAATLGIVGRARPTMSARAVKGKSRLPKSPKLPKVGFKRLDDLCIFFYYLTIS